MNLKPLTSERLWREACGAAAAFRLGPDDTPRAVLPTRWPGVSALVGRFDWPRPDYTRAEQSLLRQALLSAGVLQIGCGIDRDGLAWSTLVVSGDYDLLAGYLALMWSAIALAAGMPGATQAEEDARRELVKRRALSMATRSYPVSPFCHN